MWMCALTAGLWSLYTAACERWVVCVCVCGATDVTDVLGGERRLVRHRPAVSRCVALWGCVVLVDVLLLCGTGV